MEETTTSSSSSVASSEVSDCITRYDELKIREIVEQVFDEKLEDLRVLIECIINERLDTENRRPVQRNALRDRNQLSNFGMESYNYLLMPYLSTIVKNMGDFYAILQKVIGELYFHPDHKMNHIVYIPLNSFKSITIYKDNVWKNYELQPTLEKIARRANDVLQHYIVGTEPNEENVFKSEVGKKKFEMLREFTDMIDNMEDNPDVYDRLMKETEHTIVTTQHLVHKSIYDPPPPSDPHI